MRYERRVLPSILGGLLLLVAGCGGQADDQTSETSSTRAGGVGKDFSPIIARVGDLEITQSYFDFRYEHLSPTDKERYSGEDWRQRFLDHLIEESLVFRAAEDGSFDRLPEVEFRLDMARRSILYKAYFEKEFKQDLRIPEDRVEEYYQNNRDAYRSLGRVLGYQIQCDSKDKIDQAYAKLKAGERFAQVAAEYSEDGFSKSNGGLLGWFNPGGYIPGIGFEKKFNDLAFSLSIGEMTEPTLIAGSWHIIKVADKADDEIQPLEKVRERIERDLRPLVQREAFEQRLLDLRKSYPVSRYGEFQKEGERNADQLYRLAGESLNAHAKLHYYQSLVDEFPDDEHADEALFMIGFISSEEFADAPGAAMAFRRLMREYPDSELLDEAAWMLKHLGRAEPRLRGGEIPAGADEAGQRIDALRQ